MKRYIYYIAILFVLVIVACPHLSHTLESLKEGPDNPEILKTKLDNGLLVLIQETHALPIVSIEARFKVGSAREGEYLGSGISHFVEHMLFKGTAIRKRGDIEKEIKSYGGTINGFTSFDTTGYVLTVEKRYFKDALSLLADAIMNSSFEEEEVEKEREVILKEIRLRNDRPDRKASQMLWSTAYLEHPYKHPVIGYKELFKKLKRKDLITFYNRHYIPNNLVLGICGDIDSSEALKEVEEVFKDYERKSYKLEPLPKEAPQIVQRESKQRINVNLSRVLIGYPSISVSHKDLYALDVLASVLGEGRSSLLYKRLVETGLAYSVSSYNYTPKDPGIFLVSVLLDEANISETIKAIDSEIENVKHKKIRNAQLDKAKNSTLAGFILSHETIQSRATNMVVDEILAGDPSFSRHYVSMIKNVNLKDVSRVAKAYLNQDTRSIVYLLPKSAEEEVDKKKPGTKDEIIVEKFDLQNGTRLLVREDHSLPLVNIGAVLEGGVRSENTNNNGISNIVSEMLLRGTKKQSKDDIHSKIEALGGGISSFSGNNSFGVSLTLLSQHLDFGLELISDILLNPAFPDAELKKTKELVMASIHNRGDDIFESGIKLFKENLFKDHPYRFTTIGEKATVEKIGREDILRFYDKRCVPSNLILSVFGDVDTQTVQTKVNKLFKGFDKKVSRLATKKTPWVEPIVPPDKKVMDKEQVLLIGGFKAVTVADPQVYAFSVLSSILSGSNGRLFYDVRDKLGISYAQGVSLIPGIDPGSFLFYIATSKENAQLAKDLIAEEIQKLHKDSITEEELTLAKAGLIGAKLRRLQSNRGLSLETSLDELYGLGYDNFKDYSLRIESVTKEDIDRIVKRFLDPKKLIMVTVGSL